MKKIISLKTLNLTQPIYNLTDNFSLPSLTDKNIDVKIQYKDLSEKIKNTGLFVEGKLNKNNDENYFHWFCFDPKNIKLELDLDPNIETFAKVHDKKIPKGICSSTEFNQISQKMKEQSGYTFFESLIVGKNEDLLITEAKENKNTALISDFTNYPYNAGFFIVNKGKILTNGSTNIKPGNLLFLKFLQMKKPKMAYI